MNDNQKKMQLILEQVAKETDVPLVVVIDVINHVSSEVKRIVKDVFNGRFVEFIRFEHFGKIALRKRFKAIHFPDERTNNPYTLAKIKLEQIELERASKEEDSTRPKDNG